MSAVNRHSWVFGGGQRGNLGKYKGKSKGVNVENWRDEHYETLSWFTECKLN